MEIKNIWCHITINVLSQSHRFIMLLSLHELYNLPNMSILAEYSTACQLVQVHFRVNRNRFQSHGCEYLIYVWHYQRIQVTELCRTDNEGNCHILECIATLNSDNIISERKDKKVIFMEWDICDISGTYLHLLRLD